MVKFTSGTTIGNTSTPIYESGSAFVGIGITSSLVSRLQVYRSGSNASVLKVDGGNGTLFEVTDQLSGSLFSVNTIAGVPALEVFSNNTIVAGQYGSNVLVLTGSCVGVGTSSPAYKLDVNVTSNSDALVLRNTGQSRFILNGDAIMTWGVSAGNGFLSWDTGIAKIGGQSGNILTLSSNGTEKVRVDLNGNVGIGTTSPSAKLDLYNGSDLGSGANGIRVQRPGSYGQYGYLEYLVSSDQTILGSVYTGGGASAFGQIYFRQHSSTTSRDAMVIKPDGNIGIGTTSPSYKLDITGPATSNGVTLRLNDAASLANSRHLLLTRGSVSGSIGIAGSQTNDPLWISRSSGYDLMVASSGNIGIGTSTPSQLLELKKTSSSVIALLNYNDSVKFNINASSGGAGYIGMVSNHPLIFVNNDTERVRIDTSGNVGIGTTSPSSKLHVYDNGGSFRTDLDSTYHMGMLNEYVSTYVTRTKFGRYGGSTSNLEIYYDIAGTEEARITRNLSTAVLKFNRSTTTDMIIDGSGNIGIGTTSPLQKLDISGNIRLANPYYIYIYGRYGSGNNGCLIYQDGTGSNGGFAEIATSTWGLGYWPTAPSAGALTPYIQWSTSTESIKFRTVNADRVIIDSNGNVGIGTSSPSQKLEVSGSTRISAGELQIQGDNAAIRLYRSTGINYFDWASGQNLYLGTVTSIGGAGRTNKMVVLNDGNVGIGTNAPTQRLDLSGSLRIRSAGTYSDPTDNAGFINYDSVGGIFTISARSNGGSTYMAFRTSNSGTGGERMRIINDGNVGVGTPSPSTKLEVSGSSGTAVQAIFQAASGANSGYLGGIQLGNAASNQNSKIYHNSSGDNTLTFVSSYSAGTTNKFVFSPGGTERVRFQQDGNVGIGTSSPSRLLQVNGTAYLGGYTTITGNVEIVKAGAYLYLNSTNSDAELLWMTGGSPRWAMGMNVGDATENLNIYNYTTSTINFSILKSNGNVGIGSSTPAYKLDVVGDIGFSSTLKFGGINVISNAGGDVYLNGRVIRNESVTLTDGMYIGYNSTGTTNAHIRFFANGTTERMRIDASSGNVGIGTSSPGQKLHIQSSDTYTAIKFTNSLSNAGIISYSNDDLYFYTSNTQRLTINTNGYVGIGTTSPSTTLDVNGSTRLGSSLSSTHVITGSVNIGGNTFNNSVSVDQFDYFHLQPYIEGGNFPSNVLNRSGGNTPTFTTMTGSLCPFGKVAYNTGYYEAIGDYIPVQAGETLYGEFWAYRSSGASGTAGGLYIGVARYDKNKNAIDGNLGLTYFISSNSTVPTTSTWSKYSGTTTLPLTHTPFGGSDGGPVRYVRPYIIVNYPSGTIPTYWGAFKIRKTQVTRDNGIINVSGSLGIGTSSPATKLHVYDATAGYRALRVQSTLGDAGVEFIGQSGNIFSIQQPGSAGGLFFYDRTNSSERMRIDSNGNVGIGSSSPAAGLDVSKSTSYVGINGTDTYFYLRGYNTGRTAIITNAGSSGNYNGLAIITNETNANSLSSWRMDIGGYDGISYGTDNFWIGRTPSGGSLSRFFFINNSGNVGIGTTAPVSKLNVYSPTGTAQIFNQLQLTNMGTPNIGDIVGIGFAAGESTQYGVKGSIGFVRTGDYGRGAITFYTNNTAGTESVSTTNERMRIAADGNVGIGTTSPAYKVHISGSGQTILSLDSATTTNVSQFQVKANGQGVLVAGVYGSAAVGNNFGVSAAGQAYIGTSTLASSHPTSLVIGNASTIPIVFSTNNTEKMRLDSNGSLGIGTSSPSNRFEVVGSTFNRATFKATANVQTGIQIQRTGGVSNTDWELYAPASSTDLRLYNGTDLITFQTTGNVGIGTSSPTGGGLHIYGNTGATAAVRLQSSNGRTYDIGSTGTSYGSANNLIIYDVTGAAERVRLQSDGNVGIGTTSPGSKLNAYGSGSNLSVLKVEGGNGTLFEVTDQLSGSLFSVNTIAGVPVLEVFSNNTIVAGQYGSNVLVITGSNIGIGTNSPVSKLHIRGGTELLNSSGSTSATTSASLMVVGQNTKGGANYHDFLYTRNSKTTLNPNKHFRLDNIGNLEIINSAYASAIFTLTDSGSLSLPTAQSRNVTQLRNTGAGLKVGNYGLLFDDGNVHLHSTSPGTNLWLNCSGSGMFVVNGQSGATNGMCVGTSIQKGFVTIVGSVSAAITQPYGYLISSGAGSTTGTSPNPYSLTCDNRIMSSEFNAPSDERLKNIRGEISLDKAIDFVTKVDPIEFTWKEGVDTGLKAGYSAQQTYKAGFEHLIGVVSKEGIPEVIEPDGFISPKDAQFVMNYEQVTPYHSKLIKHLLDKIEQLENRISQLENK